MNKFPSDWLTKTNRIYLYKIIHTNAINNWWSISLIWQTESKLLSFVMRSQQSYKYNTITSQMWLFHYIIIMFIIVTRLTRFIVVVVILHSHINTMRPVIVKVPHFPSNQLLLHVYYWWLIVFEDIWIEIWFTSVAPCIRFKSDMQTNCNIFCICNIM